MAMLRPNGPSCHCLSTGSRLPLENYLVFVENLPLGQSGLRCSGAEDDDEDDDEEDDEDDDEDDEDGLLRLRAIFLLNGGGPSVNNA